MYHRQRVALRDACRLVVFDVQLVEATSLGPSVGPFLIS